MLTTILLRGGAKLRLLVRIFGEHAGRRTTRERMVTSVPFMCSTFNIGYRGSATIHYRSTRGQNYKHCTLCSAKEQLGLVAEYSQSQ